MNRSDRALLFFATTDHEAVFENENYKVSVNYMQHNPQRFRFGVTFSTFIFLLCAYLVITGELGFDNALSLVFLVFIIFSPEFIAKSQFSAKRWTLHLNLQSQVPLAYERELPPIVLGDKNINTKLSKLKEHQKEGTYHYFLSQSSILKSGESFPLKISTLVIDLPTPTEKVNGKYYRVPYEIVIIVKNEDHLVSDPRTSPKSRFRTLFLVIVIFVLIPIFLIPVITALLGN